ncbi:Zinc-responsive transcriptional regulator ZAP1 [Choanephora cucurbitarum]|uniref:Zinc-responsive transcriptional regulator ZAP1 n=1 Tax=Choanephora cucurbitarum TaxID=101091 RepID=A0A1C7NKP4_9FUNG|nr:Zinc-responsive transcriptional regulator ZAP1 [Choanephora cucurbitarum]
MTESTENSHTNQLPSIDKIGAHYHGSSFSLPSNSAHTNSRHHHHSRLLYYITSSSSLIPPSFISPSSSIPFIPSRELNHSPPKPINSITNSLPLLPPPQPATLPIAVTAVDDCCEECCPNTPTGASNQLDKGSNYNQLDSKIDQEEPIILPSIKRKRSTYTEDDNAPFSKRQTQCKWSSCVASFDTLDDLTPHLYNNHLNQRLDEEDYCSWESCTERLLDSSIQTLLNHLSSQHLKEALLHACRWIDCNERFDGFDTLTLHLSQVHVGSGKSEYRCQWIACERRGKAFTQRQKIMRHIQTHTGAKPYQCQTCQKRFSESNMVAQHMRIHTGEKPFKCDQCSKDFSVSAALTIHKRVHTGEKPFACKFQACDKRFAESSNLTKHVKFSKIRMM